MAAELLFKYTGGTTNSNPNLSIGGTGSSVTLLTVALNNLFDNIRPVDYESGDSLNYRAIDIYNDGANGALHVGFFLTDTDNLESVLAAGYDATGTQSIVNDTTAPVGITFTEPVIGSQIDLPNLASGSTHRIWIRRTVNQDSAAINDDLGYLHVWYN